MSLFANLQQVAGNLVVQEKDTLGGGGVAPSGLYDFGVKMMYMDKVASGAMFVAVELAVLVDGKERTHKETIYISNRAGEFTYADKKTGERIPMPGFATVDTLCRLTTGKGLAEQETEVKTIKLYDFDARAEMPKDKEVFMSMLGSKAKVGLLAQTVDKKVKNAEGKYVPSGETREENVIHKLFSPEGKTLTEAVANQEGKFAEAWEKKFKGKTIDKTDKSAKPQGATAGAPATGASLF